MSLKSRFFISKEAVKGNWVFLTENSDKSIAQIKLAAGAHLNPAYRLKLAEAFRPYTVELQSGLLDPKIDNEIVLKCFCENIVLDWRNIQPEDDGNNLSFSVENAIKLLGDPEWVDLYNHCVNYSNNADNYRKAVNEIILKN